MDNKDPKRQLEMLAEDNNKDFVENNKTDTNKKSSKLKNKNPKKVLLIIIFVIFFILIAVISSFITVLVVSNRDSENKNSVNDNKDKSSNDSSDNSSNLPTTKPVDNEQKSNKVVYIKENTIWIIDIEGKNKKKLVDGEDTSLGSLFELNSKEFTFTQCVEFNCSLKKLNIENEQIQNILNFDGSISAMSWSPDRSTAIIYKVMSDDTREIVIWDGTSQKIIKKFTTGILGRGVSMDDAIYIKYSPNGNYFFFFSTILGTGDSQLYIFDRKGNQIDIVEENKTGEYALLSEAIFWPIFIDNQNIVYQKGEKFLNYNVINKSTTDSDLNYQKSPEINYETNSIYYWSYNTTEKKTVSSVYDISQQTTSQITDNFVYATWYDEDTFVGQISEDSKGVFMDYFIIIGIAVVDKDGKNYKILDNGEITSFVILKD